MKRYLTALCLAALAAFWGSPVQAKPLNVVASFTVLADMVREIGGADVSVHALVGPDGDPHAFEPTPQDGQALAKADLVVVSGLGLEGWMDRLIAASGYKGKIVVASKGISPLEMEEDGKTITDPHAWNSAANGAHYARMIADALALADAAHAKDYETRGDAYVKTLMDLDAWARRQVATIPTDKRKVITSHDAFGYLGAAYGISFHAPVGVSTEAEASAADVAALIDQIKKERIKAIFIENSNDPRMVAQIAKATGAKMGGELYPESLSKSDGPVPTYVKMFRYNVEKIVEGMKAN
jgi:zinc/manganese transport system substrate-binding protein